MTQLWVGRTVTMLFSLLTLALTYRIARRLTNRSSALMATVLLAFCPFLIFYERMVLIDGYVVGAGLLVVWLTLAARLENWRRNALACGLALALAVAIKGTGIAFITVPLLAVIIAWRAWKVKWLAACYFVFGVIWLPLFLILRSRGISYFGLAETLSGSAQSGLVERFVQNLRAWWEVDSAYLSLPFLILLIGGSLYGLVQERRRALLPILSLCVPLLIILALTPLARARWLVPYLPLLLIVGVSGLELLQQKLPSVWRQTARIGIVAVWLLAVFLPFYVPLQTNPATLPLSPTDRTEYIAADSAGFALPEVAAYLRAHPLGSKTVGLLANCVGLAIYLPDTLECPLIKWDGSEQANLAKRVNELAKTEPIYVVMEALSYISTEGIIGQMQLVATFERPGGASKLSIYRVEIP
jgi:4-amino-4-deoxy-L-arabinose transferase-like glycosyltransferase